MATRGVGHVLLWGLALAAGLGCASGDKREPAPAAAPAAPPAQVTPAPPPAPMSAAITGPALPPPPPQTVAVDATPVEPAPSAVKLAGVVTTPPAITTAVAPPPKQPEPAPLPRPTEAAAPPVLPHPTPVAPAAPPTGSLLAVTAEPARRQAPTAVGSVLQLPPGESPIERALALTQRVDQLTLERKSLAERIAALETAIQAREKQAGAVAREVAGATAQVTQARQDLGKWADDLRAEQARLRQQEKDNQELLRSVVATLEKVLAGEPAETIKLPPEQVKQP